MDLTAVRRARDEAVAVAGLPGWPDPHPDRVVPDEEYSRCLEPGRYRLVAVRARAWAQALADSGLAELTASRLDWREAGSRSYGLTLLLTPVRAGAAPLAIGLGGFEGVAENIVGIGLGAHPVLVEQIPDCGCDACDSGSADLVEQLDECVEDAVTGSLVRVHVGGSAIVGRGNGWSASGDVTPARVEEVLASVRAGDPSGVEEVVGGVPWQAGHGADMP